MHLLASTIVIGLLFVVGIVLTRILIDEPEVANPDVTTNITGSLRSQYQNMRHGITNQLDEWGIVASHGTKEKNVARFRTWANGAFDQKPEIQSWLGALTDEQLGALSEHMSEFCRDMGFELDWLVSGQLTPEPELEQGLADITNHYTQASYRAVALQQEVDLFRTYQSYIRNPKSRTSRELGSQLFGSLVEQGIGNVSAEKHLASSVREREQQILETIQQAEAEQPQALNRALRHVLFGSSPDNGRSNGTHDSVGMDRSTKMEAAAG